MDGLVVAPEIDLALKGAQTDVARVRLVAGVFARVSYQVRRLAERLPADGALVRLFARVNIGVLLHVGLLVKPLVAVGTRIGPRVRVDQQVRRERRRSLEGLAALPAQKAARPGRLAGRLWVLLLVVLALVQVQAQTRVLALAVRLQLVLQLVVRLVVRLAKQSAARRRPAALEPVLESSRLCQRQVRF